MSAIQVTGTNGQTAEVEIRDGWTLMEILRDAGYDEILAMCGGSCSCATCHVLIENQASVELPPKEEDEEDLVMIAENYDAEKSRLSCQIELDQSMAGLHVRIVDNE
jgi:2Fe-2S ferredoxin